MIRGTGDEGYTDFNHVRLKKTSDAIALLGSIDETMSDIALSRTHSLTRELRYMLCEENQRLMKLSSYIAGHIEYRPGTFSIEHMDQVFDFAPKPRSFQVCWSHKLSATLNVAKASARRVERDFLRYIEKNNFHSHQEITIYLNRLSDYLYSLALIAERHYEDY